MKGQIMVSKMVHCASKKKLHCTLASDFNGFQIRQYLHTLKRKREIRQVTKTNSFFFLQFLFYFFFN